MNQVFSKFLSRIPVVGSEIRPLEVPIEDRMRTALKQLAYLTNNEKLMSLDPNSPLSFCCLSEEVIKRQTQTLEEHRKGRLLAFNPLGPDGRPVRKYVQCPRLCGSRRIRIDMLPFEGCLRRRMTTGSKAGRMDCQFLVRLQFKALPMIEANDFFF